jgi:MFS family permease
MAEILSLKINPMKLRLSAWNVVLALAVCMALQMTSFVLIMPLFARRFSDFGAGVEALGISSLAYALTSTLAAPYMGALADRMGRRPLVLSALVTYTLAFTGYLLANSAQVFIVLRALTGLFTAGLIPAVMGIIADISPQDRRARYIGIVNGGASIGWIAGPLIGGMLYDRLGYVVPFGLAIAMAALTLLVAGLIIPETHKASGDSARNEPVVQEQRRRTNLLTRIKIFLEKPPCALPTLITLLAISLVVMFAWAFIEPQMMFYVYDELEWTSAQLGLAMSAYGVAMMLGEFTLGQLSDLLGRKPVLVLGLILFSAQFVGLVVFKAFYPIAACFTLAGLGNALFDPALGAFILDIAPFEQKGKFAGLKSTAGSLGNVLGPALVVLVSPFVQSQTIFMMAAFAVAMMLFITLPLVRPIR